MKKIKYKNKIIYLHEFSEYVSIMTYKCRYTVKNAKRKFFEAHCDFGSAFGRNSASALLGAQQLIDRVLKENLK